MVAVLNVIPHLTSRSGGPATNLVASSHHLGPKVHRVIVTTDMAGTASARPFMRAENRDLPEGATGLDIRMHTCRRPYRLAYSPGLDRALRALIPEMDVVHIHMLFLCPSFAAGRYCHQFAKPYVVSPHGSLDPYMRRKGRGRKWFTDVLWQRRLLERARAIHATTSEEAQLISDIAPDVPRYVVPNGVSLDRFANMPTGHRFRERWLAGDDGPLVLYMGRISHKKGLDILIRALSTVAREVPDVRMAIVGPDDENLGSGLARLARQLGVGEAVVFTGGLYGDEQLEALAAADIWALASHTENFGTAVLEALAAGKAVVVSREVNIAADIQRAGAGLVAELTPQAFERELLGLLRSPQRRRNLSRQAAEFARLYRWQVIGPQLAGMYQRVAAQDGSN